MPDSAPRTPRETVARGYDRLVTEFAAWGTKVVDPARHALFEAFLRGLPRRARILDVGCGSGVAWTPDLAQRFSITGVDISGAQVEAARRRVPGAEFLVADVTAVEFDPGSFDGVLALYSIAHLPADEHEELFRRFARWLRPGGFLLASVPADADPGATHPWIAGVDMFFASLGADRYEELLTAQGWLVLEAQRHVAHEPEGAVPFLWILAATRDDRPPG